MVAPGYVLVLVLMILDLNLCGVEYNRSGYEFVHLVSAMWFS